MSRARTPRANAAPVSPIAFQPLSPRSDAASPKPRRTPCCSPRCLFACFRRRSASHDEGDVELGVQTPFVRDDASDPSPGAAPSAVEARCRESNTVASTPPAAVRVGPSATTARRSDGEGDVLAAKSSARRRFGEENLAGDVLDGGDLCSEVSWPAETPVRRRFGRWRAEPRPLRESSATFWTGKL